MPLRRGRDDEAPFEIIGKVGEQPLEVVLELCRPGEQPRFVIGEGIYGGLAAFEDRCAIVKKGPMTSWMSGARGEGLQATYRYAEIGGIRFVASMFTGVLEIVPAADDDPDGELVRGHGDPQKRADAIQLSKDLYEKAYDRLDWLRDQIRDARRAADPSIEPAEQLKRMRAAVHDDPSAYGLEDPEPFVSAIDDALAALGGKPRRRHGIAIEVLEAIGTQLTAWCGVTVPHDALAEIYAEQSVVGLGIARGADDDDVREQLTDVLAEELGGLDEWPHDVEGNDGLRCGQATRLDDDLVEVALAVAGCRPRSRAARPRGADRACRGAGRWRRRSHPRPGRC